MPLIPILVTLIIILLVFWVVRTLLAAFGVGEPIATVIYVIMVIVVIVWLLGLINGGAVYPVRLR